jgi:cytoskeletal protein RodZ
VLQEFKMGRLNAAQVEQLKAISADLRQQRQQAQVSLEEVAIKTYIPLRILQALEAANAEQLPEPVFVQGFIRRYGDLIGLDGTAIAKTFSTETDLFKAVAPTPLRTEPQPQPPLGKPTPPKISRADSSARPTSPQSRPQTGLQGKPASSQTSVYYALAGILGLGVVAGAVYLALPSLLANLHLQPLNSAIAPSPTSQPTPPKAAPKPKTQKTAPPPATGKTVQAAVSLTDECWLSVVVDGTSVFEGVLSKGEKRTWQAKQELTLTAGNAGALTVAFNDRKASVFGAPGQVKEVKVSKNGVQAN